MSSMRSAERGSNSARLGAAVSADRMAADGPALRAIEAAKRLLISGDVQSGFKRLIGTGRNAGRPIPKCSICRMSTG